MSTTIGDPGFTGIPAVSTPASPENHDVPNRLISASKVEGTAVYNREGERLGTVEDVMLDKVSGKVAFAVMSFGGFLGIGEKKVALDLNEVRLMRSSDGTVFGVVARTKQQLRDMPSFMGERS